MPTKRASQQSNSSGRPLPSVARPFAQPDYDIPDLPGDITTVDDDLVMGLFTKYVAWQNYAAMDLAVAEVEEAKAEGKVKFLEAQHMVLNWTSAKDKVTVARAEMAMSPEINAARQEQIEAYAKRKFVQTMYANCERCANLISREISRRIGREPTERRSMRWAP